VLLTSENVLVSTEAVDNELMDDTDATDIVDWEYHTR
jgi:hypothetical protein